MQTLIQDLLQQNQHRPERLLAILHGIQDHHRYIPDAAMKQIAKSLNIPWTQVLSVVEFYSFFHTKPCGAYDILISDSITDRMLGNQQIIDRISQRLNVAPGTVRPDGQVSLDTTSCTGLCDQGPAALINGWAIAYLDRQLDQVCELIEQRRPMADWPAALFQVQDNIQRTGLLLDKTIRPGQAISQALTQGADAMLQAVEQSGLRGRGGAGFKTAMKWRFCREENTDQRYVICNADEGEPGTFKDRVLLSRYAEQVFEGMTCAGLTIGASQGVLYLRGEYRFLLAALHDTLARRRAAGLLGDNIQGSGQAFDIDICLGAGAYICGEESALIESLEGKPGIPRNRPPYPVTHGYLGKPTVVNNVETFLAAAHIAAFGAADFAALGTKQSKGTKILSVCGDCARSGIYEVPFGTSIADVLKACGADNAAGAQIGGPSGTYIDQREFNRKLAFEDLATGGSFMVFNASRNVLETVDNFTHFFNHESCGFCTPCRVGTALLRKQLDKIVSGHGSAGDVVELEALCQVIKQNSHCGLGQTAANPILSTLERYPELYQQQLKKISYEPGFDLDAALA
ncbi:MAG: NAD(P)H-dependent oxidoreductase subunit E, partial [Methylococcales bacterium]|nr:NAD(P)H-dependent oxidoreductase subunit E [Methylococcales bacterium]